MKKNETNTPDSKYIQQHLANERTYLAWVRTSITIIGVGFLITNLHFSMVSENRLFEDWLAQFIGLASIFIGIIALVMSTITFFTKGKSINEQKFRFPRKSILTISIVLLLIFIIFGMYYLIAWELL
ncbi:YidH family protein [Fictibacillus fluitans]|uniref:DUF202 domain-containing protein n=1 Tax=Fictibacillus fluitans TaxID=3058422 RepID=A0ABT8HRF5_9BACL|nr:DUF202 domain-containing protein [Fictibacillus sp. NE201]MDN4523329.1 DUF202 domain-containing protein [Fictibacillus sp. NE201]